MKLNYRAGNNIIPTSIQSWTQIWLFFSCNYGLWSTQLIVFNINHKQWDPDYNRKFAGYIPIGYSNFNAFQQKGNISNGSPAMLSIPLVTSLDRNHSWNMMLSNYLNYRAFTSIVKWPSLYLVLGNIIIQIVFYYYLNMNCLHSLISMHFIDYYVRQSLLY